MVKNKMHGERVCFDSADYAEDNDEKAENAVRNAKSQKEKIRIRLGHGLQKIYCQLLDDVGSKHGDCSPGLHVDKEIAESRLAIFCEQWICIGFLTDEQYEEEQKTPRTKRSEFDVPE